MTKTILITGASNGIGLCCALGLKQRGYQVFATARKAEDLEKLRQQGLHAVAMDLNDVASIHQAVSEVLKKTSGKLDALFNNAGSGQPGAVEDLTIESMRRQFETNVFGPLELIKLIMPVMRQQGHGRIVNVSSILGLVCLPYRGAYSASKYAIEALSDTLRLELRDTNIRVSLIEPGPIHSNFRHNAYQALQSLDVEISAHKHVYEAVKQRFEAAKGKDGDWFNNNSLEKYFVRPPEAVLKKLIHALESQRPKVRYYVTIPAYLLAFLKRILPSRWMDKVLQGSAIQEK